MVTSSRHCEPTGRANARPMINSTKQSSVKRNTGLPRRCAPRNDAAKLVQLLDCHGDALADTDAHRRERAFPATLFHAVHGSHDQPGSAHAERMTERDGAAMRIDEIGVVLDAELTQTSDTLAGESFIELDQIEIGDF